MLNKLFKRKKAHIYLGMLAVVPNSDWNKVESFSTFNTDDVEGYLQTLLENTFTLCKLSEREVQRDDDLVVDVFVSKYTNGEFASLTATDFAVPVFWRPKVELRARVVSARTGKMVSVHRVKIAINWWAYLSRVLSPKGIFRIGPLFDNSDLEPLFYTAACQLIAKLKKSTGA